MQLPSDAPPPGQHSTYPGHYALWFPLLLVLAGCSGNTWAEGLPQIETEARDVLFSTPIQVHGEVRDSLGVPIAGATVGIGDASTNTLSDGSYSLVDLPRENTFLEIQAAGYRVERVPVHLFRPATLERVSLDPVLLQPDDGSIRLLFTGDISFGRRFLDPNELSSVDEIPEDQEDAWIQASHPADGARSLMRHVRDLFDIVDFPVVNFESPVTANPATPHPDKEFIFFSLPDALEGLHEIGTGMVSLGNNHQYDYLEAGVADTLFHFEAAGLSHAGLGTHAEEAFLAHIERLGDTDYAFMSMSSITGDHYEVPFSADDDRGGSADLTDSDRVDSTLAQLITDGAVPIALLHMGSEYTETPTAYGMDRAAFVTERGARLVVGHHPHVIQGFGFINGILTAYSLGNFAFDQDRLETMLGLMLEVDLNGEQITAARGVPVYVEDYAPRAITGTLADRSLRHLGSLSQSHDAAVSPWLGRAPVGLDEEFWTEHPRSIDLSVRIPLNGVAIIDLRGLGDVGESIAYARSDGMGLTVQPGRDLMLEGGFEDEDLDDDILESTRWEMTGDSRFACVHAPYRGTAAGCSTRDYENKTTSTLSYRSRIRVAGDATGTPEKSLTFWVAARGEGAGPSRVIATWAASKGTLTFGEEVLLSHDGGDFDWIPWVADFELPADLGDPLDPEVNPRAVRLRFEHDPPRRDRGLMAWDEAALITWGTAEDLSFGTPFNAPNPTTFLRVEGPPGEWNVNLTFMSFTPRGGR